MYPVVSPVPAAPNAATSKNDLNRRLSDFSELDGCIEFAPSSSAGLSLRRQRVLINPKLPLHFDSTPNDKRPPAHRRFYNRPFILLETIAEIDAAYRGRSDAFAKQAADSWFHHERALWMAAWPTGMRCTVRCLDGAAWDRSTVWGSFGSVEEARACAVGYLPGWYVADRSWEDLSW